MERLVKRELVRSTSPEPGTSSNAARRSSSFWKTNNATSRHIPDRTTSIKNLVLAELSIGQINVENQNVDLIVRATRVFPSGYTNSIFKFCGYDGEDEIEIFCQDFFLKQKFSSIVQINGVYRMENFEFRRRHSECTDANGKHFEIRLNPKTVIQQELDDGRVPQIPFNFVDISDILENATPVKSKIDVLAVATGIWESETTRDNQVKRDIRLSDKNKSEIILTIWGELECNVNIAIGETVALRNCEIGEYQGIKVLNTKLDTLVWVNPILPKNEGEELKSWFVMASILHGLLE